MQRNFMRKLSVCALALAMAVSMVGCSSSGGIVPAEDDLMADIKPQDLNSEPVEIGGDGAAAPTDFSVRLFQSSLNGNDNTLIAPVSVLYALSMTANGAQGDTLSQMEETLGMTVPELNAYLSAYRSALPEGDKYKLSIANSIWLTEDDRFTVEQDFLQANADYYGADIYQVSLDDAALKNINAWVNERTDGMIEEILDEIPQNAVMYLINAMAFDAEWQDIYKGTQIRDGIFTTETGEEQSVEMMYSEEQYYLEDENATGFLKYYADARYAFAALLPKEGLSVREYAAGLTGAGLSALLSDPQNITVCAEMPKFESEYSVEMSEILTSMGMEDAFDADTADFSGLGSSTEGNIFINRVLHKTFISVDEKGTRAGAATAVEEVDEAARIIEEMKEVTLDRPFVYMIIDCEANLPLFIGTLMSAN